MAKRKRPVFDKSKVEGPKLKGSGQFLKRWERRKLDGMVGRGWKGKKK